MPMPMPMPMPYLCLTYALLSSCVIDSSGYIRADEFRTYFRIQGTNFNHRLFGSFDADGNGFLSFMEFVSSVSLAITLLDIIHVII
jgi:Ca2+-binding EF-hand superfamily protein